jgi:hypothetical protein
VGTEIRPFIDVKARAAELGCVTPLGLALLPRNFDTATRRDELVHEASGLSVRAAWRADGVEETRLEPEGEHWPAAQEDAAEWIGPVIFVGAALLSNDPYAVNVALGVVANYVADLFRGVPRERRIARLSIVVETKAGATRRVDYSGPPEGIADVADVIRGLRE